MSHNKATRIIVSILGVVFGIGGMGHGFFEMLQGNVNTGGFFINAIGEADRVWTYGTEPAFTVIPNYLLTGIAAIIVSFAVIIWSTGFVHKKNGPLIFLLIFVLLFLVGGGIGQIIFFVVGWAFATRINKPLTWWRKVLPVNGRRALGKLWLVFSVVNSLLILFSLEIAMLGFVPGVNDPDLITMVMLSSLGCGLVFLILAFVSGFAYDIEGQEKINVSAYGEVRRSILNGN